MKWRTHTEVSNTSPHVVTYEKFAWLPTRIENQTTILFESYKEVRELRAIEKPSLLTHTTLTDKNNNYYKWIVTRRYQ